MRNSEDIETVLGRIKKRLPEKRTYWDMEHGLNQMRRYMERHTPDALDQSRRLRCLELGPGMGWWMYLAKLAGHSVSGIDVRLGDAMSHTAAFRAATTHDEINVPVLYEGFKFQDMGPMDIVHSRGSMSAILTAYGLDRADEFVERFLAWLESTLSTRGVCIISHNMGRPEEAFSSALERANTPLTLPKIGMHTKIARA